MTDQAARGHAPGAHVAGPAAVTASLRQLDRHVRAIVTLCVAQQAIRDPDLAGAVATHHDDVARVLHDISLEHGTDAMDAASDYAEAALAAGSLYPGEDLERFLRHVAAAVRATSRTLARAAPFPG